MTSLYLNSGKHPDHILMPFVTYKLNSSSAESKHTMQGPLKPMRLIDIGGNGQ